MEIDSKWVMDYIREYGNVIIIPKEATIIKKGAFDFQAIGEEYPEYEDGSKCLEIKFEEGSKLEIIESSAFWGITIANTIILPPSIKKIEEFAFWGCPYSVRLEDSQSLEECGDGIIFGGQKNIDVPLNIKELKLLSDLVGHLDSIRIPEGFKLEYIEIPAGVDRIILPNNQELVSTSEKSIRCFRKRNNKVIILFKEEDELSYEIVDIENKKILHTRKILCISKLYL